MAGLGRIWRLGVTLSLAGLIAFAAWLFWDLPDPRGLQGAAPPASNLIYDRHGTLLYESVPADGGLSRPLRLEEFPIHLVQATLATEDARFYDHPGVDMVGIARAIYHRVRWGQWVSGGSTITQQVARNLLLPDSRVERTVRRKLREATLALLIEARNDKDEILALYLNTTFYGRQAYGAESAARAFFGKSLSSLDLAECAFLAGLPQAPYTYAPESGDAWRARQGTVLSLMTRQGYVGGDDATLAAGERLRFAAPHHAVRAPHFVAYVLAELERTLGAEVLRAGGLRVHTTLDLVAQNEAERSVTTALERLNRRRNVEVHGAAVIAADLADGAIRVMVGSPDYFDEEHDGAVNAAVMPRQPGSAIKPVTYAVAFERGYTPASLMIDQWTTYSTAERKGYTPQNYDYSYRGAVHLREALAGSYNVVAVELLERVGLPALRDMAQRLGLEELAAAPKLGLAATLGSSEVTLLGLTQAYTAFGRGGELVQLRAIDRVQREDGAVIWRSPGPQVHQAVSPQVAYLLTDILSDDGARGRSFGTNSSLRLNRPAAVKTGTTTLFRDNWAVGYTTDLVVGVWTGNPDGSTMGEVSGVEGAAPIWRAVTERMSAGLPRRSFLVPEGIVTSRVCALSGQAPGFWCPHTVTETFIVGTEPTVPCAVHEAPVNVATREERAWQVAQAGWRETGERPLALLAPLPEQVFRLAPDLPSEVQALRISAGTSDACRAASVHFTVDGEDLGTVTQWPYEAVWLLQPGEHLISISAECGMGGRREAQARIYVLEPLAVAR